jgi:hypothetical protein
LHSWTLSANQSTGIFVTLYHKIAALMLNNRACTRKLHLSIVIAALVTSRTSIPQPSELTKAFCTCGRPAGQESPAVKQQSREKRPRACGASRWVVDLWHMHRAMLHSMPTLMHDIPTSLAYTHRGHSTPLLFPSLCPPAAHCRGSRLHRS